MTNLLRNLQRFLRAKLSIFFNTNENSNTEINQIINEVYKISNDNLRSEKKNRNNKEKKFFKFSSVFIYSANVFYPQSFIFIILFK
jgi:hypothetical protein